jgi:hypothetical protein
MVASSQPFSKGEGLKVLSFGEDLGEAKAMIVEQ